MGKFNWKDTIKVNIFLLKIVGLWPEGDAAYRRNLYTAYAIISTSFFVICHNLLQVINFFIIYKDLEALTGSIFLALTQLNSILKLYHLVKNMEPLKALMVTLNSDMFQPRDFKQEELVAPNLKVWKRIFNVFWGNVVVTLLLWAVFPFLDKSVKEHRLPFIMWYPYNAGISPLYEITYAYQLACSYFISIVNVSVDTLIAALNMYIGAQCDLLCDDLRNIDSNGDINGKWRNCIKRHKEILKFSEKTQNFSNWIVLIQFFTSCISITFTMFQLTVVVPFSSEFYSFIFYLFSVTTEIFTYCWFGNEVELKSARIPYAIFESHWTDAPEDTKKHILFFSLRCQTPIKMSALNVFYLSLGTFVNILKTSYSYFAVLHRVNAEE